MTPAQIYQQALAAGWNAQQAVVMTAIALAESSGNPGAVSKPNKNGTVDRGLFQINSVHSQYDPGKLLDPAYNAKAAYEVAGGKDFTRWSTYNSGAYKKYLGEAQAASSGGGTTTVSGGTAAAAQPEDMASKLKQASDIAAGSNPVQVESPAAPTPAPTDTAAPAQTEASGPASGAIANALSAATNKTPYVWGGNDLKGGVDCSGLIQQAYKAVGINLPRVSDQQIKAGTPVSPDQMQPGDILGWAYNNSLGGGATHVAMYIGGGMMVEALHKGEPVHIVHVRTPQFVTRVAGGGAAVAGAPAATGGAMQQPENSPDDSLEARLAAMSNAFSGSFNSGIKLPGQT